MDTSPKTEGITGSAGKENRITPREEQLQARAKVAGLTLIPPQEDWAVIFASDADWTACVDLDEVEEIIDDNGG